MAVDGRNYHPAVEMKDERIEEFRRLYEATYHESITQAEAREMASRVLTLYELLARQLPYGSRQLPSD